MHRDLFPPGLAQPGRLSFVYAGACFLSSQTHNGLANCKCDIAAWPVRSPPPKTGLFTGWARRLEQGSCGGGKLSEWTVCFNCNGGCPCIGQQLDQGMPSEE